MSKTLFFFLVILFAASPAVAEIYKWTDADGKLHFVNSESQIPDEYRKKIETRKSVTTATGEDDPRGLKKPLDWEERLKEVCDSNDETKFMSVYELKKAREELIDIQVLIPFNHPLLPLYKRKIYYCDQVFMFELKIRKSKKNTAERIKKLRDSLK